MKRIHAAIRAVIAGAAIANVLLRNRPESWDPFVYWALPMLHVFMRPLDSGPNPAAAVCCILINAAIFSVAIYFAIMTALDLTGRRIIFRAKRN